MASSIKTKWRIEPAASQQSAMRTLVPVIVRLVVVSGLALSLTACDSPENAALRNAAKQTKSSSSAQSALSTALSAGVTGTAQPASAPANNRALAGLIHADSVGFDSGLKKSLFTDVTGK
jgi:hypothetical protein